MLFNKRLLQTHLNSFDYPDNLDLVKIHKIISLWQESIRNGNYDKTKETQVQSAFLSKFFGAILGYAEMSDSPSEWYLINEAKTEIDGTKADGALGYFSKDKNITRAVIELKDANTPLDKKQSTRKDYDSPVSQAFSYSSKFDRCDWIIVSNFKEIRLYHKDRGQGYYESFEILKLDDEKEFKRFYFCLCKNNLLDENRNSLLDVLVKDTSKNEEEITNDFYKDFKNLRKFLFEHICEYNKTVDKKCLLEKTQKLLDRLVFVMFCEDSTVGLLPPFTLKNYYEIGKKLPMPNDDKIWQIIKGLFTSIDKGNNDVKPPINKYNGGLFAYDEILDNLVIKDSAWQKVIELANYDFESDLNVNILGHIFEQSLSDLEQIKAEIDGIEQDKQKSKRKKDGIFYTPEYITRYIVEQTIGTYLEENPDKLESIKILDPACGSGAFLNQAHSFLQKQYQIRTEEKINSAKASKRGGQEFVKLNLFEHSNIAETDRSILLNNIYGVDLNSESTEITKLALWLKTAKKDQPLQNLDNNIKCGNSLIDDPNIAGHKAFNWHEQFKDIMDNGGFDVIIGNPPYVSNKSMHNMGMQEYINYWNKIFYAAKSGNYDLFVLFIEQGLKLLKKGGYLAYIIPNKFLVANYAKSLLEYINKNYLFVDIFDFSKNNIFLDASVYPIVIVIKNETVSNNNSLVKRNFMSSGQDNLIEYISDWNYLNLKSEDDENIYSKIIKKVESVNNIISDLVFEPGINGFQFSNYSTCVTEGIVNEQSKALITTGAIDPYCILNKEIKYKGALYKKPYIYYNQDVISLGKWHLFSSPKIIIAGMTKRIEAMLDISGDIAPAVSVYSILYSDINVLKYVLAILNSKLINTYFLHRFQDKHLAGGYISINNNLLQKIPIPNATEEQQQSLAQKAEQMIELNKQLHAGIDSGLELINSEYQPKKISKNLEKFYTLGVHPFLEELEKQKVKLSLTQKEELITWYKEKSDKLNKLQTEINNLDKIIDQEVYKLYGLTDDEIKIVEEI